MTNDCLHLLLVAEVELLWESFVGVFVVVICRHFIHFLIDVAIISLMLVSYYIFTGMFPLFT